MDIEPVRRITGGFLVCRTVSINEAAAINEAVTINRAAIKEAAAINYSKKRLCF